MKLDRVLKLIDTYRPRNAEDALIACSLPLKYVGDGAYRYAFEIVGTNLVIKFPKGTDMEPTNVNIQHSIIEYRSVTKVLKSKARKMQALKKYMPKMYYCNQDGVVVVRKYKLLSTGPRHDRWRSDLSVKICKALQLFSGDIENSGNIGIDGRGTLKILDAGYLGPQ